MTSVAPASEGLPPGDPALVVEGLTVSFRMRAGWFAAVRGVSFALARNETLALVGESGCGKSVTALSIMRLLPPRASRIDEGRVMFDGRDLATLDERRLRSIRGDGIAMIFQEPMTSLNPVLTVGFQVAEAIRCHRGLQPQAARHEALALLAAVQIPSAGRRYDEYPHQFSGGMRQRVMIAMALACQPAVVLADEPTTALDVTTQAQVLRLLAELQRRMGMAMLFITHNMGVVAEIADRVAVMYAGEIVEMAPVAELFEAPLHPYTEALLRCIPRADRDIEHLDGIEGRVPSIEHMPAGCGFAARCPVRLARCDRDRPPLVEVGATPARSVRCWLRTPHATPATAMAA